MHHKECFIEQQRSSLATIDHSVHRLHSSISASPAPFTRRGSGVKKFGGKFERIGREAAFAAHCNDALCPTGDRLERNELRTTAARGSIMRELVERVRLRYKLCGRFHTRKLYFMNLITSSTSLDGEAAVVQFVNEMSPLSGACSNLFVASILQIPD